MCIEVNNKYLYRHDYSARRSTLKGEVSVDGELLRVWFLGGYCGLQIEVIKKHVKHQGPFINDVQHLGGGGLEFCDTSI